MEQKRTLAKVVGARKIAPLASSVQRPWKIGRARLMQCPKPVVLLSFHCFGLGLVHDCNSRSSTLSHLELDIPQLTAAVSPLS